MKEVVIGASFKASSIIKKDQLASYVGSGIADVFATPMMIALMENSAMNCLNAFLDDGETSVGTEISVVHNSASPLGMEVYAISEITLVDGRKVVFSLQAFDACGKIGEGTHTRFIVNAEKFIAKTNSKLNV